MLFLQIVLGVVLGLVVFAVLAWMLFKFWLRRQFGRFGRAAALLGDRAPPPARLHLQLSEIEEPSDALLAAWDAAHALGFRRLADLETREGMPERVRAAMHPDSGIGLCLCCAADEVEYRLFALADGQRLTVRSNGQGESLMRGGLDWIVAPNLALEEAYTELVAATRDQALRPLDLDLLRRVFERSHAQREDVSLAQPPRREALQARARAMGAEVSEQDIEFAHGMEREQWLARVREAVVDHYLQVSGIRASEWQTLEPRLQVVCVGMTSADLRGLLVDDERDAALFDQFEAQGLATFELFEAVSARRPPSKQMRRLRELSQPLRARLYGPLEQAERAGAQARVHLVQGRTADGSVVEHAVLARDSAEAQQLARGVGVGDARVLSEPMTMSELDLGLLDPEAARAAARSLREPLWLSLLRALKANVFLWGPPLAISAWNLSEGAPFGWGDILGFVYLGLAVVALVFLVGPMLAYNGLLRARLMKRMARARLCHWLLSRLNVLGGITREQLLLEKLKLQADAGRGEQALAQWQALAARMETSAHLAGRVQLLDAAGRVEEMIEAQRQALAAAPSELARVDLAMALAKHPQHAAEAARLIEDLQPQHQSELAGVAYAFTRGLLAQQAGRDREALQHFSAALAQAEAYRGSPLVQALVAEIQGWSVLSLRRCGEVERARALWQTVQPLLRLHASCRPLLEREAAEGGL